MQSSKLQDPDIILTSDASGSWGCGAYFASHWPWSPQTRDYHITVKELLPIVLAAAVWGKYWENKAILCRCDNEAVVHIVNTGTSRDPVAMGLMRCLYFIAAKFNMLLSATHLAGKANSLADALSRNNAALFLSNYPQANHQGTPIPEALTDLLVGTQPDWTSPTWSSKFNFIFKQPCPITQSAPIPPAITGTPTSAHVPAISHPPFQSLPSVSFLGQQELRHKTIKCYLSSVRFFEIINNGSDPFIKDMHRLQYVLRGIKSEEAKKNKQSNPRLHDTSPSH